MKESGVSAGRSIPVKHYDIPVKGIRISPGYSKRISGIVSVRTGLIALLIFILLVFTALAANFIPAGIDWSETFRPVGLAVINGQSPYEVEGYRVTPWAVLSVLPLAWLPENVGRAIFLVVSLLGFAYVPYRLGAKPVTLGAYLISPPVLHCLLNANIDWLPILGFVMPPQIGLFFVIIKPQIGIGIALYWLVDLLLHKGWRETLRTFTPVTIALMISFAIFGLWPMRFGEPIGYWWNASLWPASIPVGVVLVVAAIRQRRAEYAMAASPCLSPYVLLHSWSGALVALSRAQVEMVAAVIGLWIFVILRIFTRAL